MVLAVAATHVAFIAILVTVSRGRTAGPADQPAAAVVFFVPQPQPERTPPPRKVSVPRLDRATVPENTPAPQVMLPVPEDSSTAIHPDVDWYREARRSAAKITRNEAAKRGAIPGPLEHDTPSKRSWWPKGTHEAGEEEIRDGETIEWISDRCYIKSTAPPLGMPDFLARALISKGGCKDPAAGAARGDLFDKLPAYKKLHPDE